MNFLTYFNAVLEVSFGHPQKISPLPDKKISMLVTGYFQELFVTERSLSRARKLVRQHFLETEANSAADCSEIINISKIEDTTAIERMIIMGDSLTWQDYVQREQIGIWYIGEKIYFPLEEEPTESPDRPDDNFGDSDFEEDFHGKCQACDAYGPVDDLSLCKSCAQKLERDFIRQRNWDYSALAFGLNDVQREQLRDKIIREHGPKLEMLAPSKSRKKKN